VVLAVAERQVPRVKSRVPVKIQFRCECDVAVGGLIELPVHLKIAVQVGPAVATPNVGRTETRERNRGRQSSPCPLSFGNQDRSARHSRHIAVVAPAPTSR